MKLLHRLTPRVLKIAVIVLPLLAATVYYVFFAADRYVSEAIITVRQAHDTSGQPGIALLLTGVNPPSRQDTLYLQQYIHSLGLLNRLEAKLHLRAHYTAERRDPFYRLWNDTSQEDFLDYYRSRVEVRFDDLATLLTVRVEGFEPAFAQQLAQAILQESEQFVNAISQRIAREQLTFADAELQRSAQRLHEAKTQVLAFQTKHKMLDPIVQAQAAGSLAAELQAALAKQQVELTNARNYLNDDSYQMKALRNQITALRTQLDRERLRTTAGKSSTRLNKLAAHFQSLQLEVGFSEDAYKLALAAVENSRIEATRKLKSLVVIEPPSLPETAVYPRRLYNLVTLLVVCLLLYAVTRLAVATISEHQD